MPPYDCFVTHLAPINDDDSTEPTTMNLILFKRVASIATFSSVSSNSSFFSETDDEESFYDDDDEWSESKNGNDPHDEEEEEDVVSIVTWPHRDDRVFGSLDEFLQDCERNDEEKEEKHSKTDNAKCNRYEAKCTTVLEKVDLPQ